MRRHLRPFQLVVALALVSVLPAQEQEPKPAVMEGAFDSSAWNGGALSLKAAKTGIYRLRGSRLMRVRVRHPQAAKTVDKALQWLGRSQCEDGSWPVPDKLRTKEGLRAAKVQVTALALYALLAEGSNMREGAHRAAIKNSVRYLRKLRGRDGVFATGNGRRAVFANALATLAITETYWISCCTTLRKDAMMGYAHFNALWCPDGGWVSAPLVGKGSRIVDPSLTMWGVLIDLSANNAGLKHGADNWKRTRRYIRTQFDESGRPRAWPLDNGVMGVAVTRVAPSAWLADSKACTGFAGAISHLLPALPTTQMGFPDPTWEAAGSQSHVTWFATSQILNLQDSPKQRAWYQALSDVLAQHQVQAGPQAGSWDPHDAWSQELGRVYQTAILSLALTAPCQYAPLDL